MWIRVRDFVRALPAAGAVLLLGAALACGDSDEPAGESPVTGSAAAASPPKPAAKPQRTETPLPALSGWTLDEQRLSVSSLLGKRLVVYVFDPREGDAATVTEAANRVAKLRGAHNFEIVGLAAGASREQSREFAKETGIEFPVIDDSSGRLSGRFQLGTRLGMLGVDSDGYITWGILHFPLRAPDAVDLIEEQLRTALRLPEVDDAGPGQRPVAPLFSARVLDSDEPFELASSRGRAVVLIFFLHTCPHCHEALEFLKGALAEMPEDKRPLLVGLELTGRTADVRSRLKKDGLDFFPVLFDDGGEVQTAYGSFAGVPDIVLIDREGRIAGRVKGWRPAIDGPLMRMRMARLSGAPVPMLLSAQGYSGSEVCGVCHESEHQTWQLTQHARAYDTLVKHGSDTDPECVGCHVVGFGQAGGFQISPPTPALEDVGCESCHGRGGPHLSPGFVTGGDYASACVGCHDTKHSLGFEYASFLPQVSHAANAHILELPAEERAKILAERGAMRTDLLPTTAAYVGSEACRSCHAAEFETWAAGPHAGALASLEKQGKAGDTDCLRCHTTGFGRDGGFPSGAAPADQTDLARVGCESCHGPGGDHVADDAVKLGSIVSLGDKCDSCVILQICGACHDDANDPGFEFEVLDKIERIRHGTIEAGTGKPLPPRGGESAQRPKARDPAHAPVPDEAELLARAFATFDAGS